MSKHAKLSAGLLAAWLVFSLSSSALHLYRNAPNTPPTAFGIAVVTPTLLFLVLVCILAGIPAVRPIAEPAHPHTGAKHAQSQIELARSSWKSDRVTLRGKIGKSSRLFLSNRQSLLAHSGCDPRKIQTHPWVVKLHPEVSLSSSRRCRTLRFLMSEARQVSSLQSRVQKERCSADLPS